MPKVMSRSELIQRIADQQSDGLARKDIKGGIELFASVGYKELKKTGVFFVPGFTKFVIIRKPATINQFTQEPAIFKAKPARMVIRAHPVEAVKDAEQESHCCIGGLFNINRGHDTCMMQWESFTSATRAKPFSCGS
jgi:DNA-binding protein HU-beta